MVGAAAAAARNCLNSLGRLLRRRKFEFSLVVLALLVSAIWFARPDFLYFEDELFPFNPAAEIAAWSTSWNPLFNSGTSMPFSLNLLPFFFVILAVNSVGVPLWFSEYFFVALTLFLGAYGAAFAVRMVIRGNRLGLTAVAAGLLYAFNPYSMLVTFTNGLPEGLLAFAAIPWAYVTFRAYLVKVFSGQNFRRSAGLLLLTTLSFSVVIGVNEPSNLNLIPVFASIPVIAYLEVARDSKLSADRLSLWGSRIGLCFVPLALSILINSWWIVPELSFAAGHLGPSNTTSFFQLQTSQAIWAGSTSASTILATILLSGFPNWGWQTINTLYTGSTPYELVGLAIPLISFGAVLLIRRPDEKREWFFHAIVVGAILLIILGVNSPIVDLLRYSVNTPVPAQLLRYPWFSFGLTFVLYYSILFGTGLHRIWNSLAKASDTVTGSTSNRTNRTRLRRGARVGVALILAVGVTAAILVLPVFMWTGQFLQTEPASSRVSIPGYVYQTASFLKANSQGYHVLTLPGGTACQSLENWTSGYFGQSILALLSGIPTISSSCINSGAQSSILQLAFSLPNTNLTGTNYSAILAVLNVEYVVLEFDAGGPFGDLYPTPNPQHIQWFLENQPNITFVDRLGDYELFRSLDSAPEIYTSSNVISDSDSNATLNFTDDYRNRSSIPLGPLQDATVFPAADASSLEYAGTLRNYTGGPLIAVNSVPLLVNSSLFPELSISLSGHAVVSVMACRDPEIPAAGGFWNGYLLPLEDPDASTLSLSPAYPNLYQLNGSLNLSFDLSNLILHDQVYPPGASFTSLDYVAFVIWNVVNGVPESWSTDANWSYSIEVRSIALTGSLLYVTPASIRNAMTASGPARDFINFTSEFILGPNNSSRQQIGGTLNWSTSEGMWDAVYNSSLGSYAFGLNLEPFDLNTSLSNLMSVQLETPRNECVELLASSAPNVSSQQLYSGILLPLIAVNAAPFSVGPAWPDCYTIPSPSSLVFDLSQLKATDQYYPPGSSIQPLNYLALVLYSVEDSAPVQGPQPPNASLSLGIWSITFQAPIQDPGSAGHIEIPSGGSGGPGIPIYIPASSSSQFTGTANIAEVSMLSPDEYEIELTITSPGTIVIQLCENFDPGWTLTVVGDGGVSTEHIVGDFYANAWVIPPGTLAIDKIYTVRLFFLPSRLDAIGAGISLIAVAICALIVAYAWAPRALDRVRHGGRHWQRYTSDRSRKPV